MASIVLNPQDALNFTSPLLPNSQDTVDHLLDNLRVNVLPRETTHLRAVVSSAPTELALYKKHITTLADIIMSHDSGTSVFQYEELLRALARTRAECNRLSQYSAICSSALSPVRRLPAEILIQVFLLCVPVARDFNSKDYAAEINRLNHHDLLQLAHVCAHWRALALGTPAFWRVLDLDLMFWSHKMLPLVQTALERSANSPLVVRIGAPDNVAVDRSVLELIAQHSGRWQAALFYMDFTPYTSLSAIRGNLPSPGVPSHSPRLIDVTYTGPAMALKCLPWKQLTRFEYPDLHRDDLSAALSVLQYFPPAMTFELRRLVSPVSLDGEALLPPVVSDLTELTIEFSFHSSGSIADVLQRLTLPCLSSLDVAVWLYGESPPVSWDQTAFQRFCMRSACHKTLTTLYILHVAISAEDLLDCLGELKALKALVVADHPTIGDVPEKILLTDELFRRLAEEESPTVPRLIPKLAVFGGLSLLRFDEVVYLKFVHSRVLSRKGVEFESHIRWHSGSARELKPTVSEELRRFSAEKGFVGSIEAANDEEMHTFFY
ncbi:F-box domain-containing protein [Mycena venus]|uniref:F-box domain-containing protein n=1 Tax=Mycena venus TaxID=2733690 RepID=A0A8H7CPM9_9AGAR|nr:F-box domain-containing protein [Mycena venus]